MDLKKHHRSERGFTLLLAALVSSIVLAMGAAIYSIAVKELNLSSIGRDSQFAFYSADSASECALYWDINRNAFSTTSPPASVTCDGTVSTVRTDTNTGVPLSGSWSRGPGTYTFTPGVDTPANFGTLTVTIQGPGGGGGGGGSSSGAGSPGFAGSQNSSFTTSSGGTVTKVIFCTASGCTSNAGTATSFTVPSDWSSVNTIEVIGGGGGGGGAKI